MNRPACLGTLKPKLDVVLHSSQVSVATTVESARMSVTTAFSLALVNESYTWPPMYTVRCFFSLASAASAGAAARQQARASAMVAMVLSMFVIVWFLQQAAAALAVRGHRLIYAQWWLMSSKKRQYIMRPRRLTMRSGTLPLPRRSFFTLSLRLLLASPEK